jgi:hypothetical protein
MGKLFDNTKRPNPFDETTHFIQEKPDEVEDPGVCFKEDRRITVGRVVPLRAGHIASNPEIETPLVKNNLTIDREQMLIKQQRALIFKMRQVLWSIIQWNDEYKHLNNLSGDPSWVQAAYDVYMESRPK